METATLVRMANQIAGYFKVYPEEEAVAEITKHLKSFWDRACGFVLFTRSPIRQPPRGLTTGWLSQSNS